MSYLLSLLGRGLASDLGDVLDRYFWSPAMKAIAELKAGCAQHPDWPDVQFQLGLAYLRAGRLADAASHLKQACRHKPDYLAARLALAAVMSEAGAQADALEQLKIANHTHSGEAPVLFAMGFCYEKLDRPHDAAECYRDAVAGDGSFVAARERLAAVAIFLGRNDEAAEQYKALSRQFPEDARVHTALAHLHYRAGRYEQSVEEFETAIALEPDNWALADDEAEALAAQGQIREAIERLHQLVERQGPFPDLLVRLGDLYGQSGNDGAAMTHYRQALETQPNYLEAVVKVGTQHLTCGRWEEAAEAFHEACELNDHTLVNYVGLGVAQLAGGRTAEAMNSFDLASAVEPNSTVLLAEMSRLQLKAAAADEFARSFEIDREAPLAEIDLDNDHLLQSQIERHAQEVERCGHYADVRYRYGVLLRAEGRLGEAIEQFARAVEINPTYLQAVIRLGITQQELGRSEEAIQAFKQALEIRPGYVDLHYRLGLLYTDGRQFEEAAEHLAAAVAGAPDNTQLRAFLAMALQNLGLMDRAAAAWRSLWRIHQAGHETLG